MKVRQRSEGWDPGGNGKQSGRHDQAPRGCLKGIGNRRFHLGWIVEAPSDP